VSCLRCNYSDIARLALRRLLAMFATQNNPAWEELMRTRKLLWGLCVAFSIIAIPRPGHANIDLSSGSFSTTYNCSEQSQNTSGWVTCDGIKKSGDWRTALGSMEQITSAADYPAGGGGRGQRHWIGNGTNVASGVVTYEFTTPQPEIYVRWYVRFQSGLALAQSGGSHKFLYFNGTFCQGHSMGCYLLMQQGNILLTVAGTTYQDSTWGWNDLHGGQNSADGQWHCMEAHFKTNGPGTGIVQWWVDGTLRLDKNNVDYRSPYAGFGGFIMPSNGVFATVGGTDMFEDIDNMSISRTGRIGCIGLSLPSSPSNLRFTTP